MKRVGILTFHIADNCGSVMQVFALKKVLEKYFACDVEVINYSYAVIGHPFAKQGLIDLFEERKRKFEDFIKKFIKLSGERIQKLTRNNCPEYDYYIVGSDTVWRMDLSRGDTAYFLDFVPDGKVRIAYGASAGGVTAKKYDALFENNIERFQYLSVREESFKLYIQQFTDKNVSVVLDPTLLLESSDYEEIYSEDTYKYDGDYIVLYLLYGKICTPNLVNFANMISIKYGYRVIHFFPDIPENIFWMNGGSFAFGGPECLSSVIKDARLVLTDSFHGTAFSIIHKVPFYSAYTKGGGERACSLLKQLKCEDRLLRGYINIEDICFEMNWDEIYGRLNQLRKNSLQYLKKALEENFELEERGGLNGKRL